MKKTALLACAALALLALPSPAVAGCVTTSQPEVSAAGHYVDQDHCLEGRCSVWIYRESNGLDGLQRRDANRDDTCGGAIVPDTPVV